MAFLQGRSGIELTLAFALGTFATGLFVFVLVVAIYLMGDLGNRLDGLDTRIGIALFALLWLTTVVCTIGAVADVGLDGLRRDTLQRLLLSGIKWGAMDGCAVLSGLIFIGLIAGIAASFVEGHPEGALIVWFLALMVALFGGMVAGTIGACLGLAIALVELPLVMIARGIAAGRGDGN